MRRAEGSRLAAIALGALLLMMLVGDNVKQSKPRREKPIDDLGRLLEPFRAKVLELLALMRADGFKPLVWETWRSAERALALAEEGTGIALSQHTLGLAVDIVDADQLWSAPPAFWEALHRHAVALGLGRIKRKNKTTGELEWDPPHVQALAGKYDARLRLLANDDARSRFVRERYAAA